MVKAKTVGAIIAAAVAIVALVAAAFLFGVPGVAKPKFSLLSWKVEVQFDKVVLSLQWEASGLDTAYFRLYDPTGDWDITDMPEWPVLPGEIQTKNLTMSRGTSMPGTYKLVVSSDEDFKQIIFQQEFSFSSAKISIENCSVSWDFSTESGFLKDNFTGGYWLSEVNLTLVNEGDLPAKIPNELYNGPICVAVDNKDIMVIMSSEEYYVIWLTPGQRIWLSCRMIDPWEMIMTMSGSHTAPRFQPGEHSLVVSACIVSGGVGVIRPEFPKERIGSYRTTVFLPQKEESP